MADGRETMDIKNIKVVTLEEICKGDDNALQTLLDALSDSEICFGSNKQKTLITLETLKKFYDDIGDDANARFVYRNDFDENDRVRENILGLSDDVMIQID